ncbi:abnormal spindle-like microcephaly-associated protein isoform X2 [Rhinoraja longicauda]
MAALLRTRVLEPEPGSAPHRQLSDPIPVLTLTHFARVPLVSFGTVRTGRSRIERLAVDNPDTSPLRVTIKPLPDGKGFELSPMDFVVQPAERYYLSITWTPGEAGGVRETVTICVGCMKLRCILLGKAEDPPKKKRSIWESIKGKKVSESTIRLKQKRNSSIASKTIIISQKNVDMTMGRPLSPLQACENFGPVGNPADTLEYDNHEIMHLSPILTPCQIKELENYTPQSLTRFATCPVRKSKELSSPMVGKLSSVEIPDELCASEIVNSRLNLKCQSAKLFSTKTPKKNVCTSAPQTPVNKRRILSPDSFVNNSYISGEDAEPVVESSVLSPDQFLKDARMSMDQPWLSQDKSVEASSIDNLKSGNSLLQESSPWLMLKSESPVLDVEELKPELGLTFFVNSKTPDLPRNSQVCGHQITAQTKMLPAFTTTDMTSTFGVHSELENKVQFSCDNFVEVNSHFQSRSVIGVESKTDNKNPKIANRSSLRGRKRKSSEYLSNNGYEKDIDTNKKKSKCVGQSSSKTNVKNTFSKYTNGEGKRIQKRKSVSQVKSFTAPVNRGKLMPGVAQSQLTFRKLIKTVIPRHPLPFAAKNMFYDERWKEKQERGFKWWLNFILTPDDFAVNTESSRVNTATLFMGSETQHHKMSVSSAPTKEEMSLRAYSAKCRLNRLRRAACRLFTSEGMVKVIQKLEANIEANHLLVRKDRCLWKDLGHRQKILKWLLSYNPLWLRIGLECVFGEMIPLESNSDITGLARFILNRLLWNSDIAAAHRHPTVPHLYRDEHQEVLAQFTLKKFLLLVWFLDCAKQSRLIDHDPCLFCKDAEFKTSKDLLFAFSRDFLSGEGDISRHLGFLGLTVSHCQTPLHEFRFEVTNLAVDLRCGVRLVRAMELLTANLHLSKQLRVPAISRLQKLHNVAVALDVLKTRVDLKDERGNDIDSRDIVDGNREKTLALLWRIIFTFQVEILLNEDQLREEIEFLKKALATSRKLAALHSLAVVPHPKKDQDFSCMPEKYSPRVTLLMNWINAVGAYYDVKAENFTVPFSDGRILCYLIHHYHPSLLAVGKICQRTTQTVEYAEHGTVAIDISTSESENSIDAIPANSLPSANIYEELLENEKKNFNLVTTAVADLGGIPAMIRHVDMSNTIPDEKVVISYVSFLCARLLDLRKEARAARIIQAAWRKYKLNCELQLLKEKEKAACLIQRAVRRFLHQQQLKKRNSAAIIIQTTWRSHVMRQKTKALVMLKIQAVQNEAATLLQAYWRGYVGRRYFQRARQFCICLQSRIRMKIAVASYKRTLWATVTLQRHFRAHLLCLSEQRNYLRLRASAITLQSAFRRWQAHKIEKQTKAAVLLQKYIRGFLSCNRRQRSITLLQAHAKGFLIRTEMRRRKNAAITLKKYIKAYVTGKHEYKSYQRLKWAARVIQTSYRYLKVRQLDRQTKSAILIQSTFRMYKQRKRLLAARKAAVLMQTLIRMHLAQTRFLQYRQAAVTIQRHFRAKRQGQKEMQHYLKLRQVAIKIQASFRERQTLKEARRKQAAVTIQSWYRMHRGKQKYLYAKKSCIKIQSWFRCSMTQRAFLSKKTAAFTIQKYYRACRESKAQREKYVSMLKAAITIQAYVRGMSIRQLVRKVKAARVIQSYWKMRRERLKFLHYRQCIITLQAHVRRSCAQKRYHSVKIATWSLQAHFRAILAQKKAQAEYRAVRSAAIVLQSAFKRLQMRRQICLLRSAVKIQSAFRAYISRKKYMQIKNVAIKIQASVKMIQARNYYRSLKKATTCIQRRYRANKLCFEKRSEYLRKKEACIHLQSAIRQHLAKKHLYLCRQAAIKIQSVFRMHRLRSQYLRIHLAAVIIERRFHAYQEGAYQRQKFLRTKGAVICLQAAYKGYSVRKQINLQHKAASKIQAVFRGHAVRVKYLAMQNAAIAIQNWYRSYKVGQQQRFKYLEIKASVIILQAVFRGLSARKKLQVQHKAAVAIQTAFRRFRAQTQFGMLKGAVGTVQIHFKAKLLGRKERCAYLTMRQSAITIQAAYKGMVARKEFRRQRKACIVIQASFRMHKMCVEFQTQRRAALIIQEQFRAHVQSKCQRQKYLNMKAAAVSLQAVFRAVKARKKLDEMHKAATIIQSATKSFLAKRRYNTLKTASIILQRQFRALLLTRQQREIYLCIRKATLSIQTAFRGMKVRREIRDIQKAATVIQAAFRMHRVYLPYRAMRLAAIIIQTHYRAHLQMKIDRQNYVKVRSSVLLLQAAYRGMVVRKHLQCMHKSARVIQTFYQMHKQRQYFKKLRWAATAMQQRYRACQVRDVHVRQYNSLKKAAVCIQAAFRGTKTRQQLQRNHLAVTVIQRRFRAFVDRKKYLLLRTAALVIQQRYRAHVLARSQMQIYVTIQRATLSIQAAFRGMKVRREIWDKQKAATVIQAAFRMHRVYLPYRAMRLAAIIIQTHYRAHLQMKTDRQNYVKVRSSVLLLQAAYRGMVVRKHLQCMHKSARVIQTYYQMHKQRQYFKKLRWAATAVQQRYRACQIRDVHVRQYHTLKRATVCIQAAFRGTKARQQLQITHVAATVIQRRFRAFVDRKKYLLLSAAALVIQQRYRAHVLARSQMQMYIMIQRATLSIQTAFRGMKVRREIRDRQKAATVIQAAFRMHRVYLPYRAMRLAAIIIQTHYRAHLQMKTDRNNYVKIRSSVLLLQAAYRGMVVRKHLQCMHKSARVIQSYYQMHKQHQYFKKLRWAATVVQQRYRACQIRDVHVRQYHTLKRATVCIQAAFRGTKARQQLQITHVAATVIQRRFRAFVDRKKYLLLRTAALVIQQRYRAHVLARSQMQMYIMIQRATLSIQTAFRGMKVRREIRDRQKAATVIQAAFRMHRVNLPYRAMRLAAIIIQSHYGAHLQMKTDRNNYVKIRSSVLLLQAAYRGMVVRKHLQCMHKSARVIQTYYQMHKQHQYFKKLRWAATVVQQRYRACQIRDAHVRQYNSLRKAAVCIQAAFRGTKTRQQLQRNHLGATVIQRRFRAFVDRKKYLLLRTAALVIQQRYRAHVLARSQMQIYVTIQRATLSIQAAFRGMKVRREIRNRQKAATVIQAAFRMHRVYLPYRAMRLAATIIQTHYRAHLQMKTDRQNYVKVRSSVLLLQAAYRGMVVQKHLQCMHKSARVIQTYYQMHKQRQYFKKLRWAATAVQQRYQACQIRDAHVRQYHTLKRATVCIQAAFRGTKARQQLQITHVAATVIQRRFRAFVDRKKYLLLRTAALVIQQRYRAHALARSQMQMYIMIQRATLSIQTAFRGMKVRREIRDRQKAATVIQAAFRMHRVYLPYRAMRLAAIRIQTHYRAHLQMKTDRNNYVKVRSSVLLLQAAYRGMVVRKHLLCMHKSARVIQTYYQMHKQRQYFKKLRWAATVVQQRYRACQIRDAHVRHYNSLRKAAVCIQALYRGVKARGLVEKIKAARHINFFLRMCIARKHFLNQKAAIITLQASFRGFRSRVRYRAMRLAAILIQRWYKACKIGHSQFVQYQSMRCATITIQAAYKGMVVRQWVKQKRAAVKVQSVLCMIWYRKEFLKLKYAAIVVQSHYRAYEARKLYRAYIEATVVLQRQYRSYILMKNQRCAYLTFRQTVISLQARMRGLIVRRSYKKLHRGITKIQACYRGRKQRQVFLCYKEAACVIQQHYRAYCEGKVEQENYFKIKHAAAIIQASYRRYQVRQLVRKTTAASKIQAWFQGQVLRRQYKAFLASVIFIQRHFRAKQDRSRFLKMQVATIVIQRRWKVAVAARKLEHAKRRRAKAAVRIQAFYKGCKVRKQMIRLAEKKAAQRRLCFIAAAYHNICVVKIQKAFRDYMTLKRAKAKINSVIYIQRWFRTWLQRSRYINEREKIIVSQRIVKAWLLRRHRAAVVIQKSVRKFLYKMQAKRTCRGIIRMQAVWKGYWLRKKMRNPQIIAIRHRMLQANQNSHEDQKLGNRTAVAVDSILKYKHFSSILAALQHLEVATRLSAVCCENLAQSGATPIIFTLIRSCNRSVPCMDVIKYAVQVLFNLSKYEKTASVVYEVDNSVDTLLDLLYMYRGKAGDKTSDKCGSIFTKACCLLAILSQESTKALEVRSMPKAADRIRNIYKLTVRKHKMDANRINIKQRMQTPHNGCLYIPATPVRTRAVSKLKPDWVLRRDNVKEVVDPLKAIQLVVDTLGISI